MQENPMCTYITAVLPQRAVHDEVKAVFRHFQLRFEVIQNHHLKEYLEEDDVQISTSGYCDCGTSIGSLAESVIKASSKTKDSTDKLRKKGWSEAKINRWLEQKSGERQKLRQELEQAGTSPTLEILRWCELMKFLLTNRKVARFGIFWHDYSRGMDSERIQVTVERIPVEQLTPVLLMQMPENAMYTFTAH